MSKFNQFQRGAGVYTCRCCKRATRGSGGDSAGVRLCDQCYELAGYENMVSDGHTLSGLDGEEIKRLAAEVKARGGNATCWSDLVVVAMTQGAKS